MNTTALEFSLDLQEKGRGNDFTTTVSNLMKEYYDLIDVEKSTESVLAFKDESGCEFVGHTVRLIDKL